MIIKILGTVLCIFLISVLLTNIVIPAVHKSINSNYVKEISKTEFEAGVAGSERVRCIDDNEEALLWRLRMIGNAEKSIIMATFDLRADESGTDVMAALYHAAEKGVKVQLLIDGIYQLLFLKDSDTFQALCTHSNIEVRFYNPVNLENIYKVNYRMHDKYLMIDNKMYLLGGRNTTDTFLGEVHKGSNIDREVLVYNTSSETGNSFGQLNDYFQKIWNEPCVKKSEGRLKESVIQKEFEQFSKRYDTLTEKHGDFARFDAWLEDTYDADKITLISNGIHPGNKEPKVLYTIGELAKERNEIVIQTPYAVCNNYMYDVLKNMKSEADVSIILNAVEKGSNPWGCTDYLNQKQKILDTGANVYELMNIYAVHTKAVLMDDNLSIIGSYNLDMRSTYLDTELMLVIDSEELNAHIRETIEGYKERSLEVLSDGTEMVGNEYKERELTSKKKVFYSVLRVIIRPFRHLL